MRTQTLVDQGDRRPLDGERHLLVRLGGEVCTKSPRTRRRFLAVLTRNARAALRREGIAAEVTSEWTRLVVATPEPARGRETLARVFGVHRVHEVVQVPFSSLPDLVDSLVPLYRERVAGRSFAIRPKRRAPLVLALTRRANPRLRQILLRRAMYRAGSALAEELGASALVTGESLGQVSTQTLGNIRACEQADAAERQADAESLTGEWIRGAVARRREVDLRQWTPGSLPDLVVSSVPAGAVVLDVREPEEGPLAGDRRLPFSRAAELLDTLDPAQTYVLVCASGQRSYTLARELARRVATKASRRSAAGRPAPARRAPQGPASSRSSAQTTLPFPATRSAPHSSATASTITSPRPPSISGPRSNSSGIPVPASSTSTRSRSPPASTVSAIGRSPCSTALVANSLISNTTSSTWSSHPAATVARTANRRAIANPASPVANRMLLRDAARRATFPGTLIASTLSRPRCISATGRMPPPGNRKRGIPARPASARSGLLLVAALHRLDAGGAQEQPVLPVLAGATPAVHQRQHDDDSEHPDIAPILIGLRDQPPTQQHLADSVKANEPVLNR